MAAFTPQHVQDWREQGFAIIENFFSAEEIEPVAREYERIYGVPGAGRGEGTVLDLKDEHSFGEFREEQFKNLGIEARTNHLNDFHLSQMRGRRTRASQRLTRAVHRTRTLLFARINHRPKRMNFRLSSSISHLGVESSTRKGCSITSRAPLKSFKKKRRSHLM